MAKNQDKWIVELTYIELLFLKQAVTNYEPSDVFFKKEDKETTLKAINNAK